MPEWIALISPEILYEDSRFIVLNKAPRWHSSGPSRDKEPSVEDWLKQNFQWARNIPESGLVHRLDFLTSGCLLIAKSETEQFRLREALRHDQIQKIYWALARKALPPQGQFELSFESRYKSSKKITVSRVGDSNQKGRCRWRLRGSWSSPQNKELGDLLEVELLGPGKRHQIRAGLAFLGADLFGDPLYGLGHPWGLGLHARELIFSKALFEDAKERRIRAEEPAFWTDLDVVES